MDCADVFDYIECFTIQGLFISLWYVPLQNDAHLLDTGSNPVTIFDSHILVYNQHLIDEKNIF